MTPGTLVVSEVFGPTIQGEGPSAGRRAGFVRLGRCNLDCSWCDTPYTWDWDRYDPATELTSMSVADVAQQVAAMGVPMVVVTGGEPMAQQGAVADLARSLSGVRVEIETNGTIAPGAATVAVVDQFTVSPKLANSGVARDHRYRPDVLRGLEATGRAVFKFVACDPSDLDEAADMVAACSLSDVWVMPEGTTSDALGERAGRLADAVVARGWNLSPRLHILLWGDERGR